MNSFPKIFKGANLKELHLLTSKRNSDNMVLVQNRQIEYIRGQKKHLLKIIKVQNNIMHIIGRCIMLIY